MRSVWKMYGKGFSINIILDIKLYSKWQSSWLYLKPFSLSSKITKNLDPNQELLHPIFWWLEKIYKGFYFNSFVPNFAFLLHWKHQKVVKKPDFMAPVLWMGFNCLKRLQSHYEETVYFLPLSLLSY